MICCSAFAASDPTPPRPVVQRARSEGVEPWSLAARGSAPARKSASTAAEHRFRTARCNGVTPPRAAAFGSAPASARYSMTARWRAGFQFAVPGSPMTAACKGSAPRRAASSPIALASCKVTRQRRERAPSRTTCHGGTARLGPCRALITCRDGCDLLDRPGLALSGAAAVVEVALRCDNVRLCPQWRSTGFISATPTPAAMVRRSC